DDGHEQAERPGARPALHRAEEGLRSDRLRDGIVLPLGGGLGTAVRRDPVPGSAQGRPHEATGAQTQLELLCPPKLSRRSIPRTTSPSCRRRCKSPITSCSGTTTITATTT